LANGMKRLLWSCTFRCHRRIETLLKPGAGVHMVLLPSITGCRDSFGRLRILHRFDERKAQQGARANADICHDLC
jgi:hypothetical protein